MSQLALIEAIARRLSREGEVRAAQGLLRRGKAPLLERVSFLLSTGRDERNYAIGRYLDQRRQGGRFGPGGRMRRTGEYDNVYANGNDDTLRALAISLPVGGLTLREALLDRYGAMA
jgi:hypothetical protein